MVILNHSFKTGLSFGLTSGVITTLGLMVGLSSGTHSKMVVIGGILTIAIADALSDGLGIHISEESKIGITARAIWESTLATVITKFIVAISFFIPVIIFNLNTAIYISIIWGLLLVSSLSLTIAREKNESSIKIISEHVFITLLVVFLTNIVGKWINTIFS